MAFANIFVGNNTKVEIAAAPANRAKANAFTEVESVAAFPQAAGGESTVVSVNVFGKQYAEKILGSRSVPDLNLSVNWQPGSVGQEMLATAAAAQTLVQVKITYFETAEMKNGRFSIVNGYVSSDVVNGDFDSVTTREFVLSVTGAPIDAGDVVTPAGK